MVLKSSITVSSDQSNLTECSPSIVSRFRNPNITFEELDQLASEYLPAVKTGIDFKATRSRVCMIR
jgi:hypothetical protein